MARGGAKGAKVRPATEVDAAANTIQRGAKTSLKHKGFENNDKARRERLEDAYGTGTPQATGLRKRIQELEAEVRQLRLRVEPLPVDAAQTAKMAAAKCDEAERPEEGSGEAFWTIEEWLGSIPLNAIM